MTENHADFSGRGNESMIQEIKALVAECVKKKICCWCKKPAVEFRDKLSEKEYQISGFCQDCQDKTFKEED